MSRYDVFKIDNEQAVDGLLRQESGELRLEDLGGRTYTCMLSVEMLDDGIIEDTRVNVSGGGEFGSPAVYVDLPEHDVEFALVECDGEDVAPYVHAGGKCPEVEDGYCSECEDYSAVGDYLLTVGWRVGLDGEDISEHHGTLSEAIASLREHLDSDDEDMQPLRRALDVLADGVVLHAVKKEAGR